MNPVYRITIISVQITRYLFGTRYVEHALEVIKTQYIQIPYQ
jgi:hypothetical protein